MMRPELRAMRTQKIRQSIRVDDFGCWIWRGRLNANGYGHAGDTTAHRTAYELFVGRIPTGLHVDHLCRVRACVNPGHMEPVTPLENWRRGLLGQRYLSP